MISNAPSVVILVSIYNKNGIRYTTLSHSYFSSLLLVSVNEVYDKFERRFVVVEDCILPCVVHRVVILEGIAILVHKEYARHVSRSKGVVVAVVCKLRSVQCLEVALLNVYLLEEGVTLHALVAHLAVYVGVVVANHVEVYEILYLLQGCNGVLGIPLRAA